MDNVYTNHVTGIKYVLSEEAQATYEELVDSYADYVHDKYNSDEGK